MLRRLAGRSKERDAVFESKPRHGTRPLPGTGLLKADPCQNRTHRGTPLDKLVRPPVRVIFGDRKPPCPIS
jgi:hypothetical protein